MMRGMTRLILAMLCMLMLGGTAIAEIDDGAMKALGQNLDELLQLYQKKITLRWLADTRNRPLLDGILETFPPKQRKNFHANVVGDYRAVILENFDRVMAGNEKMLLELSTVEGYQALPAVVQAVQGIRPDGLKLAFAGLFRQLKSRVSYAVAQEGLEELAPVREALQTLVVQMDELAQVDPFDVAQELWGETEPGQIPIWWYDDMYGEVIAVSQDTEISLGQLDVNSASMEEISAIEGIGDALAERIVAYRAARGGFVNVTELRRIEGIGEGRYEKLAPVLRVEPRRFPKRKWTLMVYINADNDLESAGLQDINEMEVHGSTEDVNVIVQIDRMSPDHEDDTMADGNWTGTRRYVVLKDDDPKRITSPLAADLGETDMGAVRTLSDFGRWTVEHFPAERYALVIWNHGAGWQGISYDEDGGSLTTGEVLQAIQGITARLRELQPDKQKLDIVDMDACLMALLSVAYQLRDKVEYFVASQVEEPGAGMPYDKYLAELVAHPGMEAKRLSTIMVETFVRSYAKGGSQNHPMIDNTTCTKSAVALERLQPLVDAVDELGGLLAEHYEVYVRLLESNKGAFDEVRRYSDGDFVDIYHLAKTLEGFEGVPDEVAACCAKIREIIGYRKDGVDTIDRPVIVKRRNPGSVIWGVNGFQAPPQENWPPRSIMYQSRMVITQLLGPDAEGWYTANLGQFSTMRNPWTGRREAVESFEYQVAYDNGRMGRPQTVRSSSDLRIAKSFPDTSPIVAEGHTQGQGNSHGLSLYMPYPLNFYRPYEMLDFARDTRWDELVTRVPPYAKKNPVLLTGPFVKSRNQLFYHQAFQALGLGVDVLESPGFYGFDFEKILDAHLGEGVVVVDGVSKPDLVSEQPDVNEIEAFVRKGGKVLLVASSAQKVNLFTPFFRDVVGSEFVAEVERPLKAKIPGSLLGAFTAGGQGGADNYSGTLVMEPVGGAVPLLETMDGRCVATLRELGEGRIAYVGFRWESITDMRARIATLASILQAMGVEFTLGED